MRWEYYSPVTEKNNVSTGFDRTNHAIVLGTSLQNLYQFGYTVPSVVNRLEQLGAKFETYQQAGMPQALMSSDHKDFGPRAAFAYRAGSGARSFVIRGGYSISYFHIPLYGYGARMRKNAPFSATFTQSVTQAAYSPDGIGNYGLRSAPTIFAGVNDLNAITLDATQSLQPGSANVSYFALNQPDPRVQQWNITVEKEVMANTVVRAGYIGNHSSHLEQLYQYNNTTPPYLWYTTTGQPLPTGALASTGTQPYDQGAYSRVEQWQNTGWGNSNGLQLGIELPTDEFPTGNPIQVYGYKYPIQNCTSGTCFPGYLLWNGYISSNRINSVDPVTGKPNDYEGIPSNYQPAVAPLILYGSTAQPPKAPAGTNVSSFWGTNTVWVPPANGTVQRTTWAGLAPLRNQYLPSIRQWSLDASVFKTIVLAEGFRLRFQVRLTW